jgi:peroxiredoxin
MRRSSSLANPLILVPLIAGGLLPCLIFLVIHVRRANSQSGLVLKDAVVISGRPLPKTDLLELNGHTVAPAVLQKGKVLLVFFTTDCPACQKELALLSQVESEISDRLKVYDVGVENPKQIISFSQEHAFTTKFLVDKDAKLMTALSVKYFPTKFLLEDGVIVKTWFGNSPNRAALFAELGL